MGGLRAAMGDQLVAKSGDVRVAQMMPKTSGELRAVVCSAAVAATQAGTRARAPAAPGPPDARAPRAPPRRERSRRNPPQRGGRPAAPELRGVQRLVTYGDHGLARQCIPPSAMRCWLDRGWTEHDIRCGYSLGNVERNDEGNIVRANGGKGAEARETLTCGTSRGPSSLTRRPTG
eukprot:9487054-Pyramimonas_sp.AAC.1